MDNQRMKAIVFAATAYISLVVFANLGSLRIISMAGLALDGGSLLYPFTFTVRDMLHKKAGAEITRFTIWLCAGINLLLFAFIWLVGVLPADPTVGPQSEYALVLAPGVRLVMASIIAMTFSELLDTRIYALVRRHWGSEKQWLRVVLSNAVSVPIDTGIFLSIAFLGRYPLSVLGAMFLSNLLIKYFVSLISLGGIYLIKEDQQ
jgi:queuosine precursor transporter